MSGLFLRASCQRRRHLSRLQNRETFTTYYTSSAHYAHANRNETGKNRKVKLA